MLIDRGVTPGEIVTIKLASGEEIIAKLTEEDSQYYALSKPMVVVMTPNGASLIPYLITADLEKPIRLLKSAITTHIELTGKSFANRYIELTTNIKLM